MLPTELTDHRRSDEPTLLDALRAHDPLALAEAYHRTVPAGHACARRLLSSPAQIEALLLAVYSELWEEPPKDVPLEGWIRARCYALATDDLRERAAAPASPSAAALLPDLPAPDVRYLDTAERALSELDERERTVLLLAHDCGVDTATQGGDAAEVLDRALRALAGPETSSADATALRSDACPDVQRMGDWVLGLAGETTAAEIEALVAERLGCAARARALRRGRRRLEGLPPTPDMGQRILVTVLSTASPQAPAPPQRELDEDDRVPWVPRTKAEPAASQAELSTGELQLEELLRETADEADRRGDPEPADVAPTKPELGNTTTTPAQWPHTEAIRVVSTGTRDEPDEGMGGIEASRRANPYAELAELDGEGHDDLFASGVVTSRVNGPVTDKDPEGFESFYPEEELITRPSVGQRVLVAIGYVLPILLGAVLGLYLANLLLSPSP